MKLKASHKKAIVISTLASASLLLMSLPWQNLFFMISIYFKLFKCAASPQSHIVTMRVKKLPFEKPHFCQ